MTKTLTKKKEKKKVTSITDWDELISHLSMYLICNLHYYQHHHYLLYYKLFEFHRTGSYQLAHACAMSKGRRSKHFSSSINISSSWPQWVHWWIDWLINWSSDWLVDRLFGWLIDWWIYWLIDWLIDCSIDWLFSWLIDSLVDLVLLA